MLEVIQIPCLVDNYAYLLGDPRSGEAAVVDSPEAAPVLEAAQRRGWRITAIFNTHHHWDHIGSNEELLRQDRLRVHGHVSDQNRIPGLNAPVEEGDQVGLGGSRARVLHVPGHTLGHVAYWFEAEGWLFCGDTLFVGGCGRLFEGSPAQMQDSLARLRDLPGSTRVYCAHEYTAGNLKFALEVEPSNEALLKKAGWVSDMSARGEPTVPSSIEEERATNPFMRWDSPEVIAAANRQEPGTGDDPVAVLGAVRRWKDRW